MKKHERLGESLLKHVRLFDQSGNLEIKMEDCKHSREIQNLNTEQTKLSKEHKQ